MGNRNSDLKEAKQKKTKIYANRNGQISEERFNN